MSSQNPTNPDLQFSSQRTTISGIILNSKNTYIGKKYNNHVLFRIAAKEVTFENCDFQHAIIEECYFRNCKFKSCNFTGSVLRACNLKGSTFFQCTWQYARFNETILPTEFLDGDFPTEDNIREILMRSLRVNFHSCGMHDLADMALKKELQARGVNLERTLFRESDYHKSKPESFVTTAITAWRLFAHILQTHIWGHGTSIFRLIITTSLAILALIILHHVKFASKLPTPLPFEDSCYIIMANFVGVYSGPDLTGPTKWMGIASGTMGLLFFGMGVTIGFRKYSRLQ